LIYYKSDFRFTGLTEKIHTPKRNDIKTFDISKPAHALAATYWQRARGGVAL